MEHHKHDPESESTMGHSLDEKLLHGSLSETDSMTDSMYEALSRCATPLASGQSEFAMLPPPGLELPMELPSLASMPHAKTSSSSEKEPRRALCLDCLL